MNNRTGRTKVVERGAEKWRARCSHMCGGRVLLSGALRTLRSGRVSGVLRCEKLVGNRRLLLRFC